MGTIVSPVGFEWPERYRYYARAGDVLNAGMTLAASGFSILWLDGKRPATRAVARDAASDCATAYQQWEAVPEGADIGLGLVPPPRTAIIDIDDLRSHAHGLPDSQAARELTTRGYHQPVVLPFDLPVKSTHPWGDFIAGPGSYVAVTPSIGKRLTLPYVDDPRVRRWPIIEDHSEIWLRHVRAASARTNTELALNPVTDVILEQADIVVDRLLAGRYGATVAEIVAGRSTRYSSRSEADFALVFMGTHHTENLDVLAELLRRFSQKLQDKPNLPQQISYLTSVITSAINTRQLTNHQRLTTIAALLGIPFQPTPNALTVYVGTPPGEVEEMGRIDGRVVIENWARLYGRGDVWDLESGWRRVPMDDLEAITGWNRKTLWRWCKRLEAQGVIDYDGSGGERCDKGHWRKDSLIRLAGSR